MTDLIEDMLDVSEINPFAQDFLDRCDGRTAVETLARDLYGAYGEERTMENFIEACAETAQTLAKKGFLEPEPSHVIMKGGGAVAEDQRGRA